MSTVGIRLRELREAKGVSLDDIARSTRVGRRHLEALESDSWGELPAPVFVKGFIRAYCDFLDASPDEALGVYREATGESVKPERVQSILRSGPSRLAGPLVLSLVLFVALGASLFALRFGLKSSPPQAPAPSGSARSDTARVPSSASIPAAAAPAVQSQPVPVSAAEPKPGPQRLVIHAVEPTWLRVQVDDGQVSEELLPAGAVREWTASRRFVLTVGNAGGLEVDLNGKRMPSLGARGAVIQKLVLPQDMQGTGS